MILSLIRHCVTPSPKGRQKNVCPIRLPSGEAGAYRRLMRDFVSSINYNLCYYPTVFCRGGVSPPACTTSDPCKREG